MRHELVDRLRRRSSWLVRPNPVWHCCCACTSSSLDVVSGPLCFINAQSSSIGATALRSALERPDSLRVCTVMVMVRLVREERFTVST